MNHSSSSPITHKKKPSQGLLTLLYVFLLIWECSSRSANKEKEDNPKIYRVIQGHRNQLKPRLNETCSYHPRINNISLYHHSPS